MNRLHISDSGWRAVYADGFTIDRLGAIVTALAELYPRQRAVIGYDNRFLSEEFAHGIAFLLKEKGWTLDVVPRLFPTPGIATWVRWRGYDFGLVITASHNPYYYNGLKILDRRGALIDRVSADAIEKGANGILEKGTSFSFQIERKFPAEIDTASIREEYFSAILKFINAKAIREAGLKVCWDAFGGTVSPLLPAFLDSLQVIHEPVPMFEEPTYQKRRLEPDATSLKDLGTLVQKAGAAVGLATDVDGDRFSAIDENGNYVLNNSLGSLIVWYLLAIRGERGTVYQTVSCSSLTEKICKAFGVPLEIVPVGFQVMGRRMAEDPKPLIGIEETGGLAYGPHLPFKDGLMAHSFVLEMLASQKKTLTELIDQMHRTYGKVFYRRIDLKLASEKEVSLWFESDSWERCVGEKIAATSNLDGVKWTFDSGSWLLIRRSKTEPLLRLYFESKEPVFLSKISLRIKPETMIK